MSAEWNGPICLMCNGSGKDFRYILGEPRGECGIREVVKVVEVDLPCRACNGHGREPS